MILPRCHRFLAALALGALLCPAQAADKSGYSFLNRTPEALLRDLSTDRPDLTESPYTVDAGWWQIETDALFSPAITTPPMAPTLSPNPSPSPRLT